MIRAGGMTDDLPSIAERRRLGIYVPDVENRVAECFGEDTARHLMRVLGGRDVAVPRTPPNANHLIARAVGLPLLTWLAKEYLHQDTVHIPLGPFCPRTQQAVRLRRAILTMDPEASVAAIARASECSERQVRRVRAAMREREAGLNPPPPAPTHPHPPAA